MYVYAPSTSVRFYLEMCNKAIQSINVGVERGVATRGAQVVWPMIIVTARQQFCILNLSQ